MNYRINPNSKSRSIVIHLDKRWVERYIKHCRLVSMADEKFYARRKENAKIYRKAMEKALKGNK